MSPAPPSSSSFTASGRCLLVLLVFAVADQGANGLRYNYGDGSHYVGQVDGEGRPDGVGKYYNTSGALGKCLNGRSTATRQISFGRLRI